MLDLALTPDQEQLVAAVRDFCAREFAPQIAAGRLFAVTCGASTIVLPVGERIEHTEASDAIGVVCWIAVEVNRAVVPRTEYGSTVLHDGDTVEVIHFVGGG